MYALAKFLEPFLMRERVGFIEEQRSKLLEAWSKGAKLLQEARAKGSSFLEKLEQKVQASLGSLEGFKLLLEA